MAPTTTPGAETPAQFVARTGLAMDRAWDAWLAQNLPYMSRSAFRKAVKEG